MYKFISKTISFLFFSLLVYIIFVILSAEFIPYPSFRKNISTRHFLYSSTSERLREVKNIEEVDLLFIGSSHAYRSFDTRIFRQHGYDSFNMGTSSQTHKETNILLRRYLNNISPQRVIYEVYPLIFTFDGIESTIDLISNDLLDQYSISFVSLHRNILVFNGFIYEAYRKILKIGYSQELHTESRKDTYISGGFVERELSYFKQANIDSSSYAFNNDQFQYFEDNLELLRKNNIHVTLVQTPVSQSMYNSYTNNAMFDSTMSTYGEYKNYNEILPLSDSCFYDYHHLNQIGVRKFNTFFIADAIN
jgi:hypothetical protein